MDANFIKQLDEITDILHRWGLTGTPVGAKIAELLVARLILESPDNIFFPDKLKQP
jgi:hypothetical protein